MALTAFVLQNDIALGTQALSLSSLIIIIIIIHHPSSASKS
jgi:hypothetical protein